MANAFLLDIFWSLCFAVGMLYHSYTDIQEMLLYDSTNMLLAFLGLLRACQWGMLYECITGALVLGLVMLLVYLASCGGMGEGDVKLTVVLGLWLGIERGLACLVLAFVSGALVGGLLILHRRTRAHQQLPFGPFLCISALLCYFYGWEILAWYVQLWR